MRIGCDALRTGGSICHLPVIVVPFSVGTGWGIRFGMRAVSVYSLIRFVIGVCGSGSTEEGVLA